MPVVGSVSIDSCGASSPPPAVIEMSLAFAERSHRGGLPWRT